MTLWTDENTRDNPTSYDMDGAGTPFRPDEDLISFSSKVLYIDGLHQLDGANGSVWFSSDLPPEDLVEVLGDDFSGVCWKFSAAGPPPSYYQARWPRLFDACERSGVDITLLGRLEGHAAWTDANTSATPTANDMDGGGTDLATGDTVSLATKSLTIDKSVGCGDITITLGAFTTNASCVLTMDAGGDLVVGGAVGISGTVTPSSTSSFTFNGDATINSGGALGGNSAWTFLWEPPAGTAKNFANNANPGFLAPSATGSCTFKSSKANGHVISLGYFTHDGGTIVHNTTADNACVAAGPYNNFTVTGGSLCFVYANMTVESTLTVTASTFFFGGGTARTLTMGTASSAGAIVNNGAVVPTAPVPGHLITAASASYLCVLTGTDWNWDGNAGSYGLKWLDIQFDVVTGATNAITVNFTGAMTIDGWTTSAGDSLVISAGISVTQASAKTFEVAGTLNANGTSGSHITWTAGAAGVRFWGGCTVTNFNYVDVMGTWGWIDYSAGLTYTITNPVTGCTFDASSGTSTPLCIGKSNSPAIFVSCTFTAKASPTGWFSRVDASLRNGGTCILQGCTMTNGTVGMETTAGWLVSDNHNGVATGWRLWQEYGTSLNRTTIASAYRFGAADNVVISSPNVDGAGGSSTHTLVIDEDCGFQNITLNDVASALYITNGKALTPNNGGGYSYDAVVKSLNSTFWPTITIMGSTSGVYPMKWGIVQHCRVAGAFDPDFVRLEDCVAAYENVPGFHNGGTSFHKASFLKAGFHHDDI